MSDTIIKTQIRSSSVVSSNGSTNGGDKTPTTPTKLMINHGKPNFTIPRNSSKDDQENYENEITMANEKNNNYYPYKSAGIQSYSYNSSSSSSGTGTGNSSNIVIGTKFNGAFKPTNVAITPKQPHQTDTNENEASKVVLRRAKLPDTTLKQGDEDNSVPEFIRRQRGIQQRLAKENVLDFESRRSGYFTHVMISPTTPNRVSFGATMSSPPVVKALETPATPSPSFSPSPQPPTAAVTDISSETKTETETEVISISEEREDESELTNGSSATALLQQEISEEEEVAKAIEEVNKAVEGEDDEIKEESNSEDVPKAEEVTAIATTWEARPEQNDLVSHNKMSVEVVDVIPVPAEAEAAAAIEQNSESENSPAPVPGTNPVPAELPQETQRHVEVVQVHAPKENGHSVDNNITISHTNGFDGPTIPAPDPSGNLGVNYEPKTIVSFSKDLSSEPNRYPDTVKVTSQNDEANPLPVDEKLQEFTKLKFQIIAGEENVQVKPVLRDE